MKKTLLRSIQGGICSFGSPLGWLTIQYFSGADLAAEIESNRGLYTYLLLATFLVFTSFGAFVGRKEDMITTLALKDSLTNIYNQRFFIERLGQEIANARRYKTPLSLIYFDLDHFKQVNDNYGHPFGDKVLCRVTESIAKIIRVTDTFARVGGEEFVLTLPQTTLEAAKIKAEQSWQAIESLLIKDDKKKLVTITISLGVVELNENENQSQLYKRADSNLYLAKEQGRNKVVG